MIYAGLRLYLWGARVADHGPLVRAFDIGLPDRTKGTTLAAAVVIGSGIAAQSLSPGAVGLELLENAVVTAAGLFAIILIFGPVSGGHFNPVVSFADAAFGGLRWRDAAAYLPAQARLVTSPRSLSPRKS